MVISLLNQKGGVGKTTLAIHIAAALDEEHRCLLIDADVQQSALDWATSQEEIVRRPSAVIAYPKPALHKYALSAITQEFSYIVIDGPPRVNEVARSAILASQLVLIPVQPSPYDVWAAKEIVELIREADEFGSRKAAFVVNRKIVGTAIGRDVVESLSAYGLPVLKTHICQRVAFAECAACGKTVLETEPSGQAAIEIRSLIAELKKDYKL